MEMEPMSDPTLRQNEPGRKRVHSIALATFLMILGLTLSKSTGFLREIFIGLKFGYENIYAEAFYLGFQIPDLFFLLLVGGSIQAAITPTLARSLRRGDSANGWRSVSIFISTISVIMLAVTLIGVMLSDLIIPLIYASKDADVVRLAAQSSKALFPQVFFMMLAALCIGILNAYKKFSSTAFGPTFYNICVVLSIFLLADTTNQAVIRTAIGITISSAVFFILQFYMARRELKNFHFSLAWKDEGFRVLLSLAIPTMISASIVQMNTIIITIFTGGFSDGILQSLNWAKTIWQLPYGIFAVAVGSVMLPSLSAHFAAKDTESARNLLGGSLRNALFMTIPSAGLLLMLNLDVVPAIFKWTDTYSSFVGETTAMILIGYCVAVIMQTIVFIYNQAFYAIGKTKVPLFVGTLSMALTALFCFIFLAILPDRLDPLGLSMAYSLTSTISALVLAGIYRKDRLMAPTGFRDFAARSLICLCVLLLTLFGMNMIPVHPNTKVWELFWLAVRSLVGVAAYMATARLLHMTELKAFTDKIVGMIRGRSGRPDSV
jgi:putative peptidoglycan lipid II flippase